MARVLVFYQYFSTPKGAWGTRYYEFARRWVAAGHEVTIVTSIYDKSDLEPRGAVTRLEVEGIRVIAMNLKLSNKHGVLRRLWTFLAFAVRSCGYALTLPADVVVASSGPITVGIPGLLAHALRRKPLIFEVRDLWPEGAVQLGMLRSPLMIWLARRFEWLCYRSADVVVALSPGMAEGVRKTAPQARVVTIPNSADLELFSPEHTPSRALADRIGGSFVVLYAGTLGRANSTIEIVDLAEAVWKRGARDVRFVVIGDGHERPLMEKAVRERGLENVVFAGLLPKNEVTEWHAAADVTLCAFKPYPILGTCSPNKLFDSLAAGRPVINNTTGWIRDMLERTGAGLSYTPGDVSQGAEHIVMLRNDPERRRAMGAQARAAAEKEFSRGRLAASFAELFEPGGRNSALTTM